MRRPLPIVQVARYPAPVHGTDEAPRYVRNVPVDPAGRVDDADLPERLPYELTTRVFVRTVEDVHELLYHLNGLLHSRRYSRVEALLDPAGFSGLLSRTVVDRVAAASRTLVVNRFHNGYPDLLERGRYAENRAQHGEGGLEVKASRYPSGWQTHGPRSGWFCVVQFRLDERHDIAELDLEPTRIVAVMVARLERGDWSHAPAREGRIRSGTASVKTSGVVKLRRGAVWVEPSYRAEHERLLEQAQASTFGDESDVLVMSTLRRMGIAATAREVATALAAERGLRESTALGRVSSAFRRLRNEGKLAPAGAGGLYRLVEEAAPVAEPGEQP